ncbi:hypothetical protein H4R19_004300 [Coemansia spiralis]|nr:hypothetical protein H4R19_004300 [Coemansia spiralis]
MARVRYRTDEMPLLHRAVFPAQMNKFQFEVPTEQFLTLDDMEIPQVKHIHISLAGRAVGPETLVAVNRFLCRAHGSQKMRLDILPCVTGVRPEAITCTDLTILRMHIRVSADMVLEFIERLQRLQALVCSNVTTRGMQADVSVAPLDAHEPMEPLNTSLRSLAMAPNVDRRDYDTVALAKYLLVRLPSLKRFSTFRVSKQSVLDFAREYASLYPHLANIHGMSWSYW